MIQFSSMFFIYLLNFIRIIHWLIYHHRIYRSLHTHTIAFVVAVRSNVPRPRRFRMPRESRKDENIVRPQLLINSIFIHWINCILFVVAGGRIRSADKTKRRARSSSLCASHILAHVLFDSQSERKFSLPFAFSQKFPSPCTALHGIGRLDYLIDDTLTDFPNFSYIVVLNINFFKHNSVFLW